MQSLKNAWFWITTALGGLLGLAIYFLSRKNEEVDSLKTKIEMIDTKTQADLLESEINKALQDKNNVKKQNEELDNALNRLKEKREEIAESVKSMKTPEQVAKYWEEN